MDVVRLFHFRIYLLVLSGDFLLVNEAAKAMAVLIEKQ